MDLVNIVLGAAKTAKVSGAMLLAVCMHESGLKNVNVPHDGGSPTYGVCQVKMATAQMFGYQGNSKDLAKPKTNAKYAALYLKYQYNRYGDWCMAVAAYNSGTFNESKKMPGYPRNLKYVKNVNKKLTTIIFQKPIICGASKRSARVADNNGTRRRVQSAQP